jgi:two-component system cell cycle sensor histidine kinase/response regulator CckA
MQNKRGPDNQNTVRNPGQGDATIHQWFELFPEAVTIITPDGIIQQANEAFSSRFSEIPQSIVGKNIFDMISPELASDRKKMVAEVLRTAKPISWEDERNGQILRHTVYPAFSPEGEIEHLLTVGQDVTGVTRLEKALSSSVERLQLIMADAHAASWEWEVDTNTNIWSDEIWELYGLEQYSCKPSFENWVQTIIPDDREKTLEAVLQASEQGIELNIEWRVLDREGGVRWLMSRGVPCKDHDGQVIRYMGIVLDITERMRVEDKLRQNEQLFRKMFEGHTALKLIIDPDSGKIVDANQAAADFYGWSIETLREMHIHQINTLSADKVMAEMQKSRISEKNHFSFRHRRRDGSLRDVEVYCNCIEIDGKNLLYSIIHDVTDRKLAEKSLLESNERYRMLFENMLNGFAYCQLVFEKGRPVDFLYEKVNSRFETLTGLKNVEGKKASEIIPGIHERHPELLALYSQVEKSGIPHRFEFHLESLSLMLEISVYSLEKGFFVALFDNITERKQTETALRESEARFRRMFENHSASMLIIDPDTGRIVDANLAAATFYQWSVAELKQISIQQITTVTPEEVKENFRKIRSSDQNRFLFRHRRADGTCRDVEVFSKNIDITGKDFLYSIIHDVTERIRFESLAELRHQLMERAEYCSTEQLFQIVLDEIEKMTESPIGFYHIIKEVRPTGFVKDDSTGKQECTSGMEGKGRHVPMHENRIWDDAVRERKTVINNDKNEFRNCNEKQPAHPEVMRELVTPVMSGEQVIALIGVCNKPSDYGKEDARYADVIANIAGDIFTGKLSRESEKKMQEAMIQSQKMEMVGQLAGGIAHDFNNMLTVILGHTEMALQKTGSSHESLESIQKAARHSAELTRQLLAFARKQTIIPKVLNLNDTVAGMISMLDRLIGENIVLKWIPSTQAAWVKFDPSQVDQILVNLCINARDAIKGIGTITIETSRTNVTVTESLHSHPSIIPGDYIKLTITDNGPGINSQDIPHIFEPFFTTKEVGKGTGMGLSTVYGIIKQNGSYIDFQTEEGKGTSFRAYIPCYLPDATAEVSKQPEPELHPGLETILLVEDQSDILKLYKRILEQNGYTVHAAQRPHEAIRLATQYKEAIDLLVTDVIMPEMNGGELADKLHAVCPELKVLFMSGYTADFIAHHQVFDEGVDFIQKPFSLDAFKRIIQEILRR